MSVGNDEKASRNLLGRSLSGGRAGAACPRVGKFAAAAATFWAEGRLLILGGSIRLAASRLIVSYWCYRRRTSFQLYSPSLA